MTATTRPRPIPRPTRPINCDHKRRYLHVPEALEALAQHGDSYLGVLWCPIHACLHLGHPSLSVARPTWAQAMHAAQQIQRQQAKPRRLLISKHGSGPRPWRVDWSKQS